MGSILVPLAMYGWIPFVLYIYVQFPPRRAVIIGMLGAWLFLPLAIYKLPGIPAYTKMSAACYGIFLATILYDFKRLNEYRLSWIDIPMLMWCFCPIVTSLTNDLGLYDGISATFAQSVTWGFPYFLGRIYLNGFAGLRDLAVGTFLGGLIYVPFALYEIRLTTSLHVSIYGFDGTGRGFLQSIRYGGYRPSVFMEHGLMLGVWMMSASLIGVVLWRAGVIKELWNIPVSWLVGLVVMTFVLSRSTGAYVLMILGLVILLVAKWFRTTILLWLVIAGIAFYLNLGVTGEFPRKEVINAMSQVFSPERIESVDFRFANEEILSEKARQRIVFGWGGFGRNRVYNAQGRDITVTDSLWIIVYGVNGVFGLVSLMMALLLPPISFCFRYPARLWSSPMVAPAAALSVSLVMYVLDCVLNAMVNPIFALTCGAIAGVVVNPKPNQSS